MENLNLVELLRDCPTGMELDSTMYDDITFDYVNTQQNRIYCAVGKSGTVWFTPKGTVNLLPNAKCVIFPKGKTTWEGFVPPCQFKDGDIVFTNQGSIAIIYHKEGLNPEYLSFCGLFPNKFDKDVLVIPKRLATEEEKQKLFDAIKANGYTWNAETRTLEKLIVPKFKVGYRIKHIAGREEVATVTGIEKLHYNLDSKGGTCSFSISLQDEWELLPNKFDISTLKPFDKVLTKVDDVWGADFFGYHEGGLFYCSEHIATRYCIPYNDDTKHLLGTADDCDEYYKSWE